jgi:hypothetical protein
MEDNENQKKDEAEQLVREKKVYTPPILTHYGKLTEITAGAVSGGTEGSAI